MKNSFLIVAHLNLLCTNNEITDGWMDRRLELLDTVALRSLRSQSDQDFLYVLICAEDTPKHYKQRILAMMPDNGVVCWVTPEMTNYPCKNSNLVTGGVGAALLAPYIEPDKHGMVWTSHIDTDDALARAFVKTTKASFDFEHFKYHGFLYFPAGYVYFSHNSEFYSVHDTEYFFLTLREPIETFRSVLYTDHPHIHRRAPVTRMASSGPMWIKVIHGSQIGGNIYREVWGTRTDGGNPVGFGRVKKQFDIANLRALGGLK